MLGLLRDSLTAVFKDRKNVSCTDI